MDRVIIIAEAGPNHNGKLKLAYKLVNVAKRCGAEFIKFQTSIPELHISRIAKKANYQFNNTSKKETQLEIFSQSVVPECCLNSIVPVASFELTLQGFACPWWYL